MSTSNIEPETYTVRELSKLLKIGISHSYELVRSGRIGSIRIGRQYRVPKICVDEWFRAIAEGQMANGK